MIVFVTFRAETTLRAKPLHPKPLSDKREGTQMV
jgi:hypothetical protein